MAGHAIAQWTRRHREIPSIDISVRLLAIPGSHACASVAAMLDAKGVAYERVDLFPALSRAWLRLCGFDGSRVPALRLEGKRVQVMCDRAGARLALARPAAVSHRADGSGSRRGDRSVGGRAAAVCRPQDHPVGAAA